ncbi:MAG: ROK family protein [Paludibacter sp.]|nr:ROK family protein [Paludibacter sp.]
MKAIVLDLGGTRMKIGLVTAERIIAESLLPSFSGNGIVPRLKDIETEVAKMLAATNTGLSELAGVSISIPGIVDSKNMHVLAINKKFEDMPDFDFGAWTRNTWNLPVLLENDARTALVGEWQYGAGKNCNNIVLITLGTGIGGAALIEGKLLHGKHFQAGCLGGHFIINYRGSACTCGNVGCVESEASSWKLPELYRTHPDFSSAKASSQVLLDFKTLFELSAQGDKVSEDVLQHCLEAWSAGVINMIHAYDPEMVIIGGGVMKSADKILPYIREQVNRFAWTPWGKPQLKAAHFLDQAGLLGAAWLMNEYVKEYKNV